MLKQRIISALAAGALLLVVLFALPPGAAGDWSDPAGGRVGMVRAHWAENNGRASLLPGIDCRLHVGGPPLCQ